MSFFSSLKKRLVGGGDGASITGVWRVTDISVPHPFGRYVMDLRADGSLKWSSVLPTNDAGEVEVAGSGTWRTSGEELHYKSGDSSGKVQFLLEGPALVLDGLPATMIGPGVRCVFVRV